MRKDFFSIIPDLEIDGRRAGNFDVYECLREERILKEGASVGRLQISRCSSAVPEYWYGTVIVGEFA